MDGYAKELVWLSGTKLIEVPFFQRPYVWGDEQFESLIDSITDAPSNSMPFMGSIILKKYGNEENCYLIIDGQQRVTTFNVLIRVLLDVNNEKKYFTSTFMETTLKSIVYKVSLDNLGNEVLTCKLVPSNADKPFFDKVMDATEDRKDINTKLGDSQIENAYHYFYEYFSDVAHLQDAMQFCIKLCSMNKSLIFIILDGNDDEQKIFDSVNSLGKTLSNSDIIKNYIFQKMKEYSVGDSTKEAQVMTWYTKYWETPFFETKEKKDFWYNELTVGRIKTDYLEMFLKDFAIIKKIYTAKKTTGTYGLCNAYKSYIDKFDEIPNMNDRFNKIVEFAKEICEYANVYYEYKKEFDELDHYIWSDYKNRLLLILHYMDTSTFNPYILKLLKENPVDLEKKFFNLEKFLLTRFIYEATTKNYNQCCEGLLEAQDDEKYFAKYMKESPANNTSYKTKMRKLNNTQGVLFLFLIEMLHRNGEESKYSDSLNIKSYTLEHVMPQKWNSNPYWLSLDCYDEDKKKIDKNKTQDFTNCRNMAVKSIGNFSLLTSKLNTSISNSSFDEKINGNGKKNGTGMRGFAAAISITKAIIDLFDAGKVWDERVIFEKEKDYFDRLNIVYNFE